MRLSDKQISELTTLLENVHGVTLSKEQAQEAGLAIMRLVFVKKIQKSQIIKEDTLHGKNEAITAGSRAR